MAGREVVRFRLKGRLESAPAANSTLDLRQRRSSHSSADCSPQAEAGQQGDVV